MSASDARRTAGALFAPIPVIAAVTLAAGAIPLVPGTPPVAAVIARGVLVVLGAAIGAITLHELAHWIAARLMRFRTVSAVIGPFVIVPTRRGLRARWVREWRELGGWLTLEPRGERRANARWTVIAAAGPAVSLAAGIMMLQAAPALAIACLVRFALAALPVGVRGNPTDGAQVLLLLVGGAPADRFCAMRRLSAAHRSGVRPRAWPEGWIADATALHDGTCAEALACLVAFRRAVDGCAYDRASTYLDRALALRAELPRGARCTLLSDAAYFEARIHDDADRARTWLEEAARHRPACPVAERRATAAVLMASGDVAGGVIAAREALAHLERIEREEWRALPMESDWVREMIERAECAVVLPAELLALAG